MNKYSFRQCSPCQFAQKRDRFLMKQSLAILIVNTRRATPRRSQKHISTWKSPPFVYCDMCVSVLANKRSNMPPFGKREVAEGRRDRSPSHFVTAPFFERGHISFRAVLSRYPFCDISLRSSPHGSTDAFLPHGSCTQSGTCPSLPARLWDISRQSMRCTVHHVCPEAAAPPLYSDNRASPPRFEPRFPQPCGG